MPGAFSQLLSSDKVCQQRSPCTSHLAATESSPSHVSSKAETGAALLASQAQEPTISSTAQHINITQELLALEEPGMKLN